MQEFARFRTGAYFGYRQHSDLVPTKVGIAAA
jgi:hypothetical protein